MRIADWILLALILAGALTKGGGIDPDPKTDEFRSWHFTNVGGVGAGAEG